MGKNLKAKIKARKRQDRRKITSISRLAEKLGVSQGHLSNMLAGRRKMSDKLAEKLERILKK